ncbi:MAG: FG-GAP-like repeat-containing protein [Anaerolineales bacterium]
MVRILNVQYVRRGMFVLGWVVVASVLCLLAVYVYRHNIIQCIDGCGPYPNTTSVVDLDGDGDLDVYAASLPPRGGDYDSADRVLLNDGSGNFVDSGQRLENDRLPGTAGSGAVALGDLDDDGDLDALVATSSGAPIWINQGSAQGGQAGVFSDSDLRLGHNHIKDIFLADLDTDGDPDAVVGEKTKATVWLDSVTSTGKAQASIW